MCWWRRFCTILLKTQTQHSVKSKNTSGRSSVGSSKRSAMIRRYRKKNENVCKSCTPSSHRMKRNSLNWLINCTIYVIWDDAHQKDGPMWVKTSLHFICCLTLCSIFRSPSLQDRCKEYFRWSKEVVNNLRGTNDRLEQALDEIFRHQNLLWIQISNHIYFFFHGSKIQLNNEYFFFIFTSCVCSRMWSCNWPTFRCLPMWPHCRAMHEYHQPNDALSTGAYLALRRPSRTPFPTLRRRRWRGTQRSCDCDMVYQSGMCRIRSIVRLRCTTKWTFSLSSRTSHRFRPIFWSISILFRSRKYYGEKAQWKILDGVYVCVCVWLEQVSWETYTKVGGVLYSELAAKLSLKLKIAGVIGNAWFSRSSRMITTTIPAGPKFFCAPA